MISIIIPTYNEKRNIILLTQEIKKNLIGFDYEIIIVDDNSPDGTGDCARLLSEKDEKIRHLIRKNERGLATAIKRGIESSKGDTLVVLDADFSHPPKIIPLLVNLLNDNDLVVASRYIPGGSMDSERYKFFLSKLLNHFIRFVLNLKISDPTGGFFAIKKDLLNKIDKNYVFQGYGDYFFKLSYLIKDIPNIKIKEIPFRYDKRKFGSSKTTIFDVGISYIFQALRIRTEQDLILDLAEKLIINLKYFFIFIFGGFLGALINWIITFFLTSFVGLWYLFSFLIGSLFNILFNFFYHKSITFKIKKLNLKNFLMFIIIYFFILVLSLSSVYIQTNILNFYYIYSVIFTTLVVSLINFLLNKFFVFKKSHKCSQSEKFNK